MSDSTLTGRRAAIDYRNDEKWDAFADAYIEHNGNCKVAVEIAGVNPRTATKLNRHNEDFQKFLAERRRKRLEKAELKIENRVVKAVETEKHITKDEQRTFRFFAEWTGKIAERMGGGIVVNGDLNVQQNNFDMPKEKRMDLMKWAFEHRDAIEGQVRQESQAAQA